MITVVILFFLSMFGCGCVVAEPQGGAEFIVQQPAQKKKSLSKNELKEHIGREIKNTFECTTTIGQRLGQTQCLFASLQQCSAKSCCENNLIKSILTISAQCNNVFGSMQKELSLLQQKCSDIVEKIIDNEAPFKKASKNNLDKTLAVIVDAHQQLIVAAEKVHKLGAELKVASQAKQPDAHTLDVVSKTLGEQEKVMRAVCASFAHDECLKGI